MFFITWFASLSHSLSCTYCFGFNTFSIVDFDTKPTFHLTNTAPITQNINFWQTNFPNLTTHVFQSLQRPSISKQETKIKCYLFLGLFFFVGTWKRHSVFLRSQTKGGQISIIRGNLQASIILGENIVSYEAQVRFGTRVRVRDSAIFEKGGCGCARTRRLKNY